MKTCQTDSVNCQLCGMYFNRVLMGNTFMVGTLAAFETFQLEIIFQLTNFEQNTVLCGVK